MGKMRLIDPGVVGSAGASVAAVAASDEKLSVRE
jgi:hypothetical protein